MLSLSDLESEIADGTIDNDEIRRSLTDTVPATQ